MDKILTPLQLSRAGIGEHDLIGQFQNIFDCDSDVIFKHLIEQINQLSTSPYWINVMSSILCAVLGNLCFTRDAKDEPIDYGVIREALDINNILNLAFFSDRSENVVKPIQKYFKDRPGFTVESARNKQLEEKVVENYSYLLSLMMDSLNKLESTVDVVCCAKVESGDGERHYLYVVYPKKIISMI